MGNKIIPLPSGLSLTIALMLSLIFPCPAEVITLKSGQKIEGRIEEKTDSYVRINFEGISLTYFKEDILSIDDSGPKEPVGSYTAASGFRRTPESIFREISPVVVYILSKTIKGEEFLGSGLILDSSGIIITNYHVIGSTQDIYVKLLDGRIYPATGVVDFDVIKDIFVFKIDAYNLPEVKIGDSNLLRTGDTVYCIGNPLGLEYSLSDGMISGLRESLGARYIQFTAPISSGNSGGPLINSNGEIIGIVTFTMVGGQNLNFALAACELKPFLGKGPKMTFREFAANVAKASLLVNQAVNYYSIGDNGQAISLLKQALQLDPRLIEAPWVLARIYCNLGQDQEAKTYAEKALEIDPNNLLALMEMGNAYRRLRQTEKAEYYLQRAIQLYPDEGLIYGILGEVYVDIDQYDKAIPMLEKAIQLLLGKDNYTCVFYYADIALCYKMKDDVERCIEYLGKANQLNPEHPELYMIRGLIAKSQKNYEEAGQNLQKAKQLFEKEKHYRRVRDIDGFLKELEQEERSSIKGGQ